MARKKPHTPRTSSAARDLRDRKKETVLGSEETGKGGWIPIALAVVLVAAIAAGYTLYHRPGTAPASPMAPAAAMNGGGMAPAGELVSYPVSLFEDGQARHFEFQDGGRTIRYFVIRSADGVIRAAFDACDVCWPAGKGYVQEGDAMVCRNCGRKFASDLVNEVEGGCNPAPLKRRVENGLLVISPDDIRGGSGYFDFKEGTRS